MKDQARQEQSEIEVEEYDLGGETHAAAGFTVFIVSPKTTTTTTVFAVDQSDDGGGDEGGI